MNRLMHKKLVEENQNKMKNPLNNKNKEIKIKKRKERATKKRIKD